MKKIFLCVALLLNGCYGQNETKRNNSVKSEKKENKMQKSEKIEFNLGMSYEKFRDKYPNIATKKVMSQNFHEKRWSSKNPATIVFHYDEKKTLELPHTIHLFFSEVSRRSKKGLIEFQTQTGITKADLLPYEEARAKFHTFLQNLLSQGWERALSPYDPRISGRHAMHYKLTEDKRYRLDPAYEPTLEEWKKLEKGGFTSPNYWVLHYKSKIFIEIKLGVVPHKTDPELASYLMFITIRDGEEVAMRYFDGDEKLKWKELWYEVKEEAIIERAKIETKLKAKGYTMDESYEDYVIDPKEW